MAKGNAVWGIDIGQCALKALRCSRQGNEIVADAFDFIEYPKILSQPEADPEQLIHEALQQFLERNDVKECKIAMSVPGQAGLSKFFKPPPVDAKKIPEIVKYEARQQIPFDLDDVIWDYQTMGGVAEADGFAIDSEVGLFAMKRDQVFRSIAPFERLAVELDIVQLAPVSIYNFVAYDLLHETVAKGEFDPDSPPESLIILSMGTETTDLVITNGFRLWQRSIPLGGSHFTKQLTKDLKLTFAKAEHLKRNARQAEDPKSVFQAMRPVFNDLVTELQRSIGFFQGIDRQAKLGGVVLLGNTVKLPGLQQYLAKNLGYEVLKFDSFSRLSGPSVVSAPAFQDNINAFASCYGLCIQGLNQSSLATNLVPREILINRLVRQKKPWAIAGVSALLLACALNFSFNYLAWRKVQTDRSVDQVSWSQAEEKMEKASEKSRKELKTHEEKVEILKTLDALGGELVGNADRRLLWMELLRAFNEALPKPADYDPDVYVDPANEGEELWRRPMIYVDYFESEYFDDVKDWYSDDVKNQYREVVEYLEKGTAVTQDLDEDGRPKPAKPAGAEKGDTGDLAGPEGAGWVIEISGYHYFNDMESVSRANVKGGIVHLWETLVRNLQEGSVELPFTSPDGTPGTTTFTLKELGLGYPIVLDNQQVNWDNMVANPAHPNAKSSGGSGGGGTSGGGMSGGSTGAGGGGFAGGAGGAGGGGFAGGAGGAGGGGFAGGAGGAGGGGFGGDNAADATTESDEPTEFEAPKFSFRLQFCWQEKMLSERIKERQKKAAEAQVKGNSRVAANTKVEN